MQLGHPDPEIDPHFYREDMRKMQERRCSISDDFRRAGTTIGTHGYRGDSSQTGGRSGEDIASYGQQSEGSRRRKGIDA